MTKTIDVVIAVLALAAGLSAAARQKAAGAEPDRHLEHGPAGRTTSIPVALVLKQDGQTLTGTISMPTQRIGETRGRARSRASSPTARSRCPGTVEGATEPTTIEITGKLNDDGSMEGTSRQAPHGEMPWTAERLKERRSDTAVAPRRAQGARRHGGAAVPRRDDARRRACSPRRRRARSCGSSASRWCTARPAARDRASRSTCGRRRRSGRDFDLAPTSLRSLEPFRDHLTIVSNTDVDPAEPFTAQRDRRRSLPIERGVPHAGASEADAGRRRRGRHVARPAVRAAVRPGHADSVDAAVHRERRSGRRLRLRLLVRLHRHDQLGVADAAAADDPQSARRLRRAVRRVRHRRHAGGARASGARRTAASSIGCCESVGAAAADARRGGPGAAGRLPRQRPRDRAAHPDRRGAQPRAASRASCPTRRPASRIRFREHVTADVRPAGARVRVGHHARVRVQARPRQLEPHLSGERLQRRVPQRVAPQRARGSDPRTSRRSTPTTSA